MTAAATKILITGAGAQLAAPGAAQYAEHADVRALRHADLDITNAAAVRQAVSSFRPTHVINCASYNNVDGAEDDSRAALSANAFGVRVLARATAEADAALIHYSTVFVFDGRGSRPYTEEDAPNPGSVYAASKLLGEWFALEIPKGFVLRVASLFGGKPAKSSVDRIVDALVEGRSEERRVGEDCRSRRARRGHPVSRGWAPQCAGPRLRRAGAVRAPFLFQAEDGIRVPLVTGVQTCALPIFEAAWRVVRARNSQGICVARGQPLRRQARQKLRGPHRRCTRRGTGNTRVQRSHGFAELRVRRRGGNARDHRARNARPVPLCGNRPVHVARARAGSGTAARNGTRRQTRSRANGGCPAAGRTPEVRGALECEANGCISDACMARCARAICPGPAEAARHDRTGRRLIVTTPDRLGSRPAPQSPGTRSGQANQSLPPESTAVDSRPLES